MPTRGRHLRAAAEAEGVATYLLDNNRSPAWVAIMAFYAAVHWVEAFLALSDVHPHTHVEREIYLTRSQLRLILDNYRTLRTRSEDARYELVVISPLEAEQLISGELALVKQHVQGLLPP